jgi:tetratricopeptide (TPR) repeat protein
VYHNLASSYHQLALKHYQTWKRDEKDPPFKLSMTIDPSTRASGINLRGGPGNQPADLFNENIEKAIEMYQKAISLDPSYCLSFNNLGCALILKGETYKAVGMLQDTIKIKPDFAEALNNLGVAFYYAKNSEEAKDSLAKARELDPTYNAPLFNLAKIAQAEKNGADTKKYGEAFLNLDPDSSWADSIRTALSLEKPKRTARSAQEAKPEDILGLRVGASQDEVPAAWAKPEKVRTIPLEEEPFHEAMYANGLMTISQSDEILFIIARENCGARSLKGISLGNSATDITKLYGAPPVILNTTQGVSWVYQSEKIAFQMRDGRVVSWVLF